jgi:hypothetical protein
VDIDPIAQGFETTRHLIRSLTVPTSVRGRFGTAVSRGSILPATGRRHRARADPTASYASASPQHEILGLSGCFSP